MARARESRARPWKTRVDIQAGVREASADLACRGREGLERPFQTRGSERGNGPHATGLQGEPGFSYAGGEGESQGLGKHTGVSGDERGVPDCTVDSCVLSRAARVDSVGYKGNTRGGPCQCHGRRGVSSEAVEEGPHEVQEPRESSWVPL